MIKHCPNKHRKGNGKNFPAVGFSSVSGPIRVLSYYLSSEILSTELCFGICSVLDIFGIYSGFIISSALSYASVFLRA